MPYLTFHLGDSQCQTLVTEHSFPGGTYLKRPPFSEWLEPPADTDEDSAHAYCSLKGTDVEESVGLNEEDL